MRVDNAEQIELREKLIVKYKPFLDMEGYDLRMVESEIEFLYRMYSKMTPQAKKVFTRVSGYNDDEVLEDLLKINDIIRSKYIPLNQSGETA